MESSEIHLTTPSNLALGAVIPAEKISTGKTCATLENQTVFQTLQSRRGWEESTPTICEFETVHHFI